MYAGVYDGKSMSADVSSLLVEAYLDPEAAEMQHIGSHELPSGREVAAIVELCRALLFPGYAGPDIARSNRELLQAMVHVRLDELATLLHRQVYCGVHHKKPEHKKDRRGCAECTVKAREITSRFIEGLPALRAAVRIDLQFAFQSDPAATGIDEILLTYPGCYAVTVYRIAHRLLREGCPIVPRIMTEIAHRKTGIDIHPAAEIGEAFFIDHGTGVVIGETTRIGNRVRVYQGVTLGALSVPQGEARPQPGERRHPTLEDDVVIYANATILGGSTTIGKGAVVGGNAFVTSSVAAGTKVSGAARAPSRSA
jgi:serine O-acetyltransferase